MNFELKGKVALVTGAMGGIGQAIAQDFSNEGVQLSLSYNKNKDEEFINKLKKTDPRLVIQKCDVTKKDDILRLVKKTLSEFGRIDILVNNAGMGMKGSIENTDIEAWENIMNVNLKSVFMLCKEVLPIMKNQNYGRIINIGSVNGKTSTNSRPWLDLESSSKTGGGAYAASKAGVHTLTKTLAKELAPFGITVNCIAPGPIKTNMVPKLPEPMREQMPLGRLGQPEEISAFVVILASQRAGFITGEIIDINGGLWMD